MNINHALFKYLYEVLTDLINYPISEIQILSLKKFMSPVLIAVKYKIYSYIFLRFPHI